MSGTALTLLPPEFVAIDVASDLGRWIKTYVELWWHTSLHRDLPDDDVARPHMGSTPTAVQPTVRTQDTEFMRVGAKLSPKPNTLKPNTDNVVPLSALQRNKRLVQSIPIPTTLKRHHLSQLVYTPETCAKTHVRIEALQSLSDAFAAVITPLFGERPRRAVQSASNTLHTNESIVPQTIPNDAQVTCTPTYVYTWTLIQKSDSNAHISAHAHAIPTDMDGEEWTMSSSTALDALLAPVPDSKFGVATNALIATRLFVYFAYYEASDEQIAFACDAEGRAWLIPVKVLPSCDLYAGTVLECELEYIASLKVWTLWCTDVYDCHGSYLLPAHPFYKRQAMLQALIPPLSELSTLIHLASRTSLALLTPEASEEELATRSAKARDRAACLLKMQTFGAMVQWNGSSTAISLTADPNANVTIHTVTFVSKSWIYVQQLAHIPRALVELHTHTHALRVQSLLAPVKAGLSDRQLVWRDTTVAAPTCVLYVQLVRMRNPQFDAHDHASIPNDTDFVSPAPPYVYSYLLYAREDMRYWNLHAHAHTAMALDNLCARPFVWHRDPFHPRDADNTWHLQWDLDCVRLEALLPTARAHLKCTDAVDTLFADMTRLHALENVEHMTVAQPSQLQWSLTARHWRAEYARPTAMLNANATATRTSENVVHSALKLPHAFQNAYAIPNNTNNSELTAAPLSSEFSANIGDIMQLPQSSLTPVSDYNVVATMQSNEYDVQNSTILPTHGAASPPQSHGAHAQSQSLDEHIHAMQISSPLPNALITEDAPRDWSEPIVVHDKTDKQFDAEPDKNDALGHNLEKNLNFESTQELGQAFGSVHDDDTEDNEDNEENEENESDDSQDSSNESEESGASVEKDALSTMATKESVPTAMLDEQALRALLPEDTVFDLPQELLNAHRQSADIGLDGNDQDDAVDTSTDVIKAKRTTIRTKRTRKRKHSRWQQVRVRTRRPRRPRVYTSVAKNDRRRSGTKLKRAHNELAHENDVACESMTVPEQFESAGARIYNAAVLEDQRAAARLLEHVPAEQLHDTQLPVWPYEPQDYRFWDAQLVCGFVCECALRLDIAQQAINCTPTHIYTPATQCMPATVGQIRDLLQVCDERLDLDTLLHTLEQSL